jgi:hypothetical protein
MQGLQHQAVAAERHDGLCLLGRNVAVECGEALQRGARLRHLAGDKRDLLEFSW